jgi:hypothetical protein
MRSTCRTALCALVAVLALGALTATASAAETPEFSRATHFTGSFGTTEFGDGVGAWAYDGLGAISGEITTSHTITGVTIKFTEGTEGSCNTTEETHKHELVLAGLKARLGIVNKAEQEVGMLFEAAEPKHLLARCSRTPGEVGKNGEKGAHGYLGDFIAQITPVRTLTKHFTLTLSTPGGSSNKQKITAFEGEKANPLTLGFTNCNKSEECTLEAGLVLGINTSISLETEKETEIEKA